VGKAGRARRMDGGARRAAHNMRNKPAILSPRRKEMGRDQKSPRGKTQRLILLRGADRFGSPAPRTE